MNVTHWFVSKSRGATRARYGSYILIPSPQRFYKTFFSTTSYFVATNKKKKVLYVTSRREDYHTLALELLYSNSYKIFCRSWLTSSGCSLVCMSLGCLFLYRLLSKKKHWLPAITSSACSQRHVGNRRPRPIICCEPGFVDSRCKVPETKPAPRLNATGDSQVWATHIHMDMTEVLKVLAPWIHSQSQWSMDCNYIRYNHWPLKALGNTA